MVGFFFNFQYQFTMTIDFFLFSFDNSSASNRIIHAKDHASIQINFVDIDESGLFKSSCTAYAICGALRRMVCIILQ